MKNYHRVMLGQKSVFAAQCFAEDFIGADFGIAEDGTFYYVMELADDWQNGQSFNAARYVPKTLANELVRRQAPGTKTPGRLSPGECVEVALSLTSALSALHRNGLAHRDIKPTNI